MMVMRAKMKIMKVDKMEGAEMLHMSAVGKSDKDGNDEDNTYAKFTPNGTVTLMISNTALHGKFNPGECYYIDFTEANK
jgi:hypothetical protein